MDANGRGYFGRGFQGYYDQQHQNVANNPPPIPGCYHHLQQKSINSAGNPAFPASGSVSGFHNRQFHLNFNNDGNNALSASSSFSGFQNSRYRREEGNSPQNRFSPLSARAEWASQAEVAASKAYAFALSSGETISLWKIAQSVTSALKVESLDALGLKIQQIPTLNKIMLIEGKINAFIHCYVASVRIATLWELNKEICKQEGVSRFEDLGLGPLLGQPIIDHYFAPATDAKDVFKISVKQVVSHLYDFLDINEGSDIILEEFLTYMCKKEAVPSPAHLCIRIQSLRMYVGFLRRAKKAEKEHILKMQSELEKNLLLEKRRHTSAMQSRVVSHSLRSLSMLTEDVVSTKQKHIRFDSSSSEDEDESSEMKNVKSALTSKSDFTSKGSCPYPSAAEELARLGKRSSNDNPMAASPKKGDSDIDFIPLSSPKRRKRDQHDEAVETHLDTSSDDVGEQLCEKFFNKKFPKNLLLENELKIFIESWKDICCKQSAREILKKMIEYQGPVYKRKGVSKIRFSPIARSWFKVFNSWPGFGLFNIAVLSIKMGMWDNVMGISFGPKKEDKTNGGGAALGDSSTLYRNDKATLGLSSDEVLQQLIIYFRENNIESIQVGGPLLEQLSSVLNIVHKCERWLTKKFSVLDFSELGYGDFLDYLKKHLSKLPANLSEILSLNRLKSSSIEVCVSNEQFLEILYQFIGDSKNDRMLTQENIYDLLHNQFPGINFKLSERYPVNDVLKKIEETYCDAGKNKVRYSAALLGKSNIKGHACQSSLISKTAKTDTHFGSLTGAFGHTTDADALQCLLKAPMLSDLEEWSHWDHVFAPTLGPLLCWLDKEGAKHDIVCLLTRSGKVIRIYGSATVDGFLSAALKGEEVETVTQLISIASLYGGIQNAPVSLLKSHASRALETLVKNIGEVFEANDFRQKGKTPGFCNIHTYQQSMKHSSSLTDLKLYIEQNNSNTGHNTAKPFNGALKVAGRFILDCLTLTPQELRAFVADILLSGLSSLYGQPFKMLSHQCISGGERMMLHEIGFSNCISEWINDYHEFLASVGNSSWDGRIQKEDHDIGTRGNFEKIVKQETNLLECVQASNSIMENIKSTSCIEQTLQAPSSSLSDTVSHDDLKMCAELHTEHPVREIKTEDPKQIIEAIRRDEFGLDIDLQVSESMLLKKQHARLSRALQHLSQELYSHDSHFLLELIQNADDNTYPENVEPTLAFILQKDGVIVLNNEVGFTAKNIKALCDVGNSTKMGAGGGHIGQKGIGFKSVFRITDAPEIHSNGFHIKFDITEGELGFILPTPIAPLSSVDLLSREVALDCYQNENFVWNTCIFLPFRQCIIEGTGLQSCVSKFTDLHPSLLLFLNRLRCIKVRDCLTNSFLTMKREDVGNGIVKVSYGKESSSWLVVSQTLNVDDKLRPGTKTSEIAMAFRFQENSSGDIEPCLEQQPVYAFLPLRAYGLKFVIQADFILPSSREEVDGDSAWNQWLLSEIPDLFSSAASWFHSLPFCKENPGKAVSLHMSYVPLVGEVLGFFSPLPRMILSKLRVTPCLPLEGHGTRWVLPCRAIRGWTDSIRNLIPDDLIDAHIGLGYLHRDAKLSDALAVALGVPTYGPKILLELLKSICKRDELGKMGLNWLGSLLVSLCECLNYRSSECEMLYQHNLESDIVDNLAQISFIPLSNGSYASIKEGSIWLPSEAIHPGTDGLLILRQFPRLYSELRTVHPSLFLSVDASNVRDDSDTIIRILRLVGVSQLTNHEVVTKHVLNIMSNSKCLMKERVVLAEYLAFVMMHLQSSCSLCRLEKTKIISELREKAIIITNNGYKFAASEPIHFGREYGNSFDMKKIVEGTNVVWNEVDGVYLHFAFNEDRLLNISQWRKFLSDLGVTDLMHVTSVDKKIDNKSNSIWKDLSWETDGNVSCWTVRDWESAELLKILTNLSYSSSFSQKCSEFLEVLDKAWDEMYGIKKAIYWPGDNLDGEGRETLPSFVLHLRKHCWVKSTLDRKLYFPTELFFDCREVRSIVGSNVAYVDPQVHSRNFVGDLGLKTTVDISDVLSLLTRWNESEVMFRESTLQMEKLYSFLWKKMDSHMAEILSHFKTKPSIFVPSKHHGNKERMVNGTFLQLNQVCWRDPTGCLEWLSKHKQSLESHCEPLQIGVQELSKIYPSLHNFFIDGCSVKEVPDFDDYLNIMKQIASAASPSKVKKQVIQVICLWAEAVHSGCADVMEISRWKECFYDPLNSVLPTLQDKWISLHSNYGLICWNDDDDDDHLGKQFMGHGGVHFLLVSSGTMLNNSLLEDDVKSKVTAFWRALGIPPLSELVVREAIFYGVHDNTKVLSLVNWLLPYAQRYMHKMHPVIYQALQDTIFSPAAKQLCVVVVDKLFYRHTLQGIKIPGRHECPCLLQGKNFFVSQSADISTICSELSRVFFSGRVDLQLANFLHLITIMAESGSSEEQTESFIQKAQNIPLLPFEEVRWSCESEEGEILENETASPAVAPGNSVITKRPLKVVSHGGWPPTSWSGISAHETKPQRATLAIPEAITNEDGDVKIASPKKHDGSALFPQDNDLGDLQENENSDFKSSKHSWAGALSDQGNELNTSFDVQHETTDESFQFIELPASVEHESGTVATFSRRNRLCTSVLDDEERQLTGRIGERFVYKYLSKKYGAASVRWVNEKEESGSAFDMILCKDNGEKEFIEVKTTRSDKKDWFEITSREWDFASQNGDCFTIIRVILGCPPYVKLVMLENPINLYRQHLIKLAILMPTNRQSFLPEITLAPQDAEDKELANVT